MGCGCGVSIQKHHIERLPELITADELRARNQRKYLIEDSIEGWAEAALELILSYMPMYQYQSDCDVIFIYDQVRPAGSPISSGGRTAGPEPLRTALNNIRDLLTRCVQVGQRQLKPIDCFDICGFIDCFDICGFLSDAVLSGGVRRSASIMLFSPDDQDMMEAKTGGWWQSAPWRATANISALIAHDPSLDELTELLSYTQQYGEPAVFFSRPSIITNPCAEIGLKPTLDVDGEEVSGWQACNLTEIVAPKCSNVDTWLKACKAAAILGTLQAAYTDAGYLLEVSRLIVEAEALIGVSITGICGAPDLLTAENLEHGASVTAENLEHGASVVKRWNQITADAIGINAASRLTCVKPSGNSSVLAGCSAGAHPWHSKRFIRRMRLNKMNPVWQAVSEPMAQ
jgi:ribonucleoside-diphosphate reductase alpha chain